MRALKTLVIVMGVLIVVGVGVVVGAIIDRTVKGGARSPAITAPAIPNAAPNAASRGFGDVSVDLPRGARIEGMLAAGDHLVLRLQMTDGTERLLVLDPGSGERLGTIELRAGQ